MSGSPRLGGLHRFMGWDGPILTDSGGFQVFSLAHLGKVDEDGVTFASHLDGSPQRLTPERAVEIQEALGSDIAMAFDQLRRRHPAGRRVRPVAMQRTHAGRSAASPRTRGRTRRCSGSCRAASMPISAGRASQPIGALAVRRDRHRRPVGGGDARTRWRRPSTSWPMRSPDDPRVRYLMGVGSPPDFFTAVERGIDLFDCVLPTRVARTGQLWTSRGAAQPAQRPLPRRPRSAGQRVPLRDLSQPLAGLPRPPLPRRGAARLSALLAAQRHLYSGPHAAHPRGPRRRVVRNAARSCHGPLRRLRNEVG